MLIKNKANNQTYDVTQSEPNTFGTSLTNKTSKQLQLGAMEAIQPISDKTTKIDPNKAATWFIQYKKAIESILRLGEGTTSQCSLEQCSAFIYQIKERLP